MHLETPQHYMFGSRSWIDPESVDPILKQHPQLATKTMIPGEYKLFSFTQHKINKIGAGHHIYADNPTDFNANVLGRI